ncbi:AAA family ATPase [Haloferula sp. A504]|uniref:AAA family ATPase n=1 Tax=Haloferula sp. A504 TaxID=3373601 RepID=UPI0031BC62CD|nr:ATP-binding protein [Verrucomicrobiaceae bacterium E54]
MPRQATRTRDTRTSTRESALQKALDPRRDIPLGVRLQLLHQFRQGNVDEAIHKADELILRGAIGLGQTLLKAHADLKDHIDILTSPPFFPGIYLGPSGERRARVRCGEAERIVGIDGDHELRPGDPILLNSDRTVILDRCEKEASLGEVARFVHLADGGRIVLDFRGESLVCLPVNGLAPDALRKGDLVLINPPAKLAIERITEPEGGRMPFEVEEEIGAGPEDVGGLERELDELLWSLLIAIEHPETARRHRIAGFSSIILQGPPGGGKTLMARVAAAELQRRTGKRTRFLTVRPSEWRSEWVGVGERAIRETFAAIRNLASQGGHVVVFLDEAESLGRVRGGRATTVLDDLTNALLVELDGFSGDGLNNVVVISATNRKDLLDPALRDRLSGVEIRVPRPRMDAARAIFRVHLREDDPWADPQAREEAIETAVSLLYAPAGDTNEVCRIRFNDGSSRVVRAGALISGRLIRQISDNARRLAARREVDGQSDGLGIDDLVSATEQAIDTLRTTLTRDNAASCLEDLPQDLAIVAVDPIWPTHRRHRQPR